MKFYYACIYTDRYGDDESLFYTCSENELKSGHLVIIEYNNHFFVCTIDQAIDELTALINNYDIRPALTSIDPAVYLKSKESKIKQQIIINNLESRAKEVKLMDSFKKLATGDEEMKKMLDMLNALADEN